MKVLSAIYLSVRLKKTLLLGPGMWERLREDGDRQIRARCAISD
jgi:hypothetical protein